MSPRFLLGTVSRRRGGLLQPLHTCAPTSMGLEVKRQKMCFRGSHVFASLDKKPAGIRWRRGWVIQRSLLLPRIQKDKQGFVSTERRCLWHTPFTIENPACPEPPFASEALCMASAANLLLTPSQAVCSAAWSCAGSWPLWLCCFVFPGFAATLFSHPRE